jgi:DNA-directed RNA polymerase subunit E'/Rpb7
MAQIKLYYKTQLDTKVSLLPNQINGNIDDHILDNLKAKMEGKSNEFGIIIKINHIIFYDYGIIPKSNFSTTVVYHVTFECLLCSPNKNLEVICVVDNIIKGFLICRNGPVRIAIQFNNIDFQKFEVKGDNIIYLKSKSEIVKGDYLKIVIINVNYNIGQNYIVTIGKLLDMASETEIATFEEEQKIANNVEIQSNKVYI